MIKIQQNPKHYKLQSSDICFSVYSSSGSCANAIYGDTAGTITQEPDWIIKNKCKILGLHPEKDIEIFDDGYGSIRARILNVEALYAKHPEVAEWNETQQKYPDMGFDFYYKSFNFVKVPEWQSKDSKLFDRYHVNDLQLSVIFVK